MEDLQQIYKTHPFEEYVKILDSKLREHPEKPDALVVSQGRGLDSSRGNLTSSLFSQLFKVDLTNFTIVLTHKTFIAFGSQEKGRVLKPLIDRFNSSSRSAIGQFVMIDKGDDLKQSIATFVDRILADIGRQGVIGSILQEMQQGKYITTLADVMSDKMPDAKVVDVTKLVEDVVSIRLPEEEEYFNKCATVLCKVYRDYLVEVEKLAEKDQDISQGKLSKNLSGIFEERVGKYAAESKIEADLLAQVINPCIQSGGEYTLSLSFKYDEKPLQYDAVTMSAMLSYYDYKCLVSRTLLFRAEKSLENDYKLILESLKDLNSTLKPGAVLSEVYEKVKSALTTKRPSWVDKLSINFGYGVDPSLLMKEKLNTISATCKSVVRQGQVYYICIGVNDMTDKRKEKIAVIVGDTVVIGKHGNEVITGAVSKAFSDVYRYKEKSKKKRAGSGSSRDSKEQRNTKNTGTMDAERSDEAPVEKIQILTRRQKLQLKNGPTVNKEFEELNKIAEHQRTLVREKNEEMRERLARGDFILANAAPQ